MTKLEKIAQSLLLKIVDFCYRPFARLVPKDFFRYGFAGGLNTLFDWVLYFVLYHFAFHAQVVELGFVAFTPHIAAFVFKFPITFLTGFWLNRHISFEGSTLLRRTQLARYLLVVAGCILLNYGCLKLFVEVFEFYPTPSNMLTTVITTAFSYFSQKYFSFRKTTKADENQ
jgi:putative flippase GtrA